MKLITHTNTTVTVTIELNPQELDAFTLELNEIFDVMNSIPISQRSGMFYIPELYNKLMDAS